MFRKKEAATPVASSSTYSWPKQAVASQELWILIEDWQYKVFPSRQANSYGTWMFQFEGVCETSPMKGVVAAGDIETLESGEHLGMLEDRWKVVPEKYEGFLHFSDDNDVPLLGMTLLCKESALDAVHKAFLIGAASRRGSTGIRMAVDCPNNPGGEFWDSSWRSEWLRVLSWSLFAGAQFKDAPR